MEVTVKYINRLKPWMFKQRICPMRLTTFKDNGKEIIEEKIQGLIFNQQVFNGEYLFLQKNNFPWIYDKNTS